MQGVARGKTIKEAARRAGISRRTATRRMEDPDVLQQISEMRSNLMEVAVDKLCRAAEPATQTLYSLLNAPSDNVKLNAARTILEKSVTVRDHNELDVRMQEIELIHAETSSPSVAQSYWPDSLEQGPPAVDGLDISQGYRHKANWYEFMIYTGGLTEEQVQEVKQKIADLRNAAQQYDAAMAT